AASSAVETARSACPHTLSNTDLGSGLSIRSKTDQITTSADLNERDPRQTPKPHGFRCLGRNIDPFFAEQRVDLLREPRNLFVQLTELGAAGHPCRLDQPGFERVDLLLDLGQQLFALGLAIRQERLDGVFRMLR